MAEAYYKYVGNGEFVPGVPARDLAEDEAVRYGVEGCPLYERVEAKEKRSSDSLTGISSDSDPSENEGGGV